MNRHLLPATTPARAALASPPPPPASRRPDLHCSGLFWSGSVQFPGASGVQPGRPGVDRPGHADGDLGRSGFGGHAAVRQERARHHDRLDAGGRRHGQGRARRQGLRTGLPVRRIHRREVAGLDRLRQSHDGAPGQGLARQAGRDHGILQGHDQDLQDAGDPRSGRPGRPGRLGLLRQRARPSTRASARGRSCRASRRRTTTTTASPTSWPSPRPASGRWSRTTRSSTTRGPRSASREIPPFRPAPRAGPSSPG